MKRVQYGKRATLERLQHEEGATGEIGYMKIVQHELSTVTEWNSEKSAQKECTSVHKRITGRPLTDLYTDAVFAHINVSWWNLGHGYFKNSH